MPRKKEEWTDENSVKYSIIVPIVLDEKMRDICRIKKYNRSMLLRELMDRFLDRIFAEAQGQVEVEGEVTVHLNDETRTLLLAAAHDANLQPSSVIQLLLTRALPTFVEETRSCREQIAALLADPPAGENLPKPKPAAGKKKK